MGPVDNAQTPPVSTTDIREPTMNNSPTEQVNNLLVLQIIPPTREWNFFETKNHKDEQSPLFCGHPPHGKTFFQRHTYHSCSSESQELAPPKYLYWTNGCDKAIVIADM